MPSIVPGSIVFYGGYKYYLTRLTIYPATPVRSTTMPSGGIRYDFPYTIALDPTEENAIPQVLANSVPGFTSSTVESRFYTVTTLQYPGAGSGVHYGATAHYFFNGSGVPAPYDTSAEDFVTPSGRTLQYELNSGNGLLAALSAAFTDSNTYSVEIDDNGSASGFPGFSFIGYDLTSGFTYLDVPVRVSTSVPPVSDGSRGIVGVSVTSRVSEGLKGSLAAVGISVFTSVPDTLTAPSKSGYQTFDAHFRPAAALAGTSVAIATSRTAGHTYDSYSAGSEACDDPSLIYDRATNHPRLIYSSGGVIKTRLATGSGENSGDWSGSSATLSGISGAYPFACPHPSDRRRVYLLYLDSGTLKLAQSFDGGAGFGAVSTISTGLDFSVTGRAVLLAFGDTCLLAVYGSGSNLLSKASADAGGAWASAVTIASSGGPYSRLAGAAVQGVGTVLAVSGTTLHLWQTGTLGGAWTTGTAPTLPTNPAGLAIDSRSGLYFYGETLKSADGATTWIAA